jgi:site-specific recombinase XerD
MSSLARDIDQFLAYKRALGRRYSSEETTLRIFDRYIAAHSIPSVRAISPDLIDAFLRSRPRRRPGSVNALLGILRIFFQWLVARRILARSPVHARPRRAIGVRAPVILGPDQIARLLGLAGRLSDAHGGELRGPTFRTVFAVLYALGLRVGEACRLRIRDIDWERRLLVIRESKFGKSRLVPFGPRLGAALADYLAERRARRRSLAEDGPVFCVTHCHPLTRQAIGRVFRQFRGQLGIVLPDGASPARVHDLRHSFAVRALLRWYRSGIDPAQRILHLSTFLGHVQPESTALYLTITSDLLDLAGMRFERLAEALLSRGAT